MSWLDWASPAPLPTTTGQTSPLTWPSSTLTPTETSLIAKKAWNAFLSNQNLSHKRFPQWPTRSLRSWWNLYFVYLKTWEIWTLLKSETSRMLVVENSWSIQSAMTSVEEIPQRWCFGNLNPVTRQDWTNKAIVRSSSIPETKKITTSRQILSISRVSFQLNPSSRVQPLLPV